jgi:hypothetical protein
MTLTATAKAKKHSSKGLHSRANKPLEREEVQKIKYKRVKKKRVSKVVGQSQVKATVTGQDDSGLLAYSSACWQCVQQSNLPLEPKIKSSSAGSGRPLVFSTLVNRLSWVFSPYTQRLKACSELST